MRQLVARQVLSLSLRVGLALGTAALAAGADYYKLPNIERIDRDLYRSAEVVIETRSCVHQPAGEEALLKYEGPGDYKIIWQDHSTCEVERVAAVEADYSGRQSLAFGRRQNAGAGTRQPVFYSHLADAPILSWAGRHGSVGGGPVAHVPLSQILLEPNFFTARGARS